MKSSFRKAAGLSLACVLTLASAPLAMAQNQMQQNMMTITQQQQVTIPAGTALTIRETGFAGERGDAFAAELLSPIRVNGEVVVPAGSRLVGSITDIDDNNRRIVLNTVLLPDGRALAFNSTIATEMPAGVAAVREEPLTGQVTRTREVSTLFPRVSWGPDATPAAKIIGGTLGGAALGAATGTLGTLTMRATNQGMRKEVSRGTAAAQGLAWGAAYGAGFGLLTGIISAATTSTPVAVTSTTEQVGFQPAGQTYNVTLDQSVTLSMATQQEVQTQTYQQTQPIQEQRQVERQSEVRGFW